MKSVNDSKVNEPSTILSQMMPSRHMAGRTEYLCEAIDGSVLLHAPHEETSHRCNKLYTCQRNSHQQK